MDHRDFKRIFKSSMVEYIEGSRHVDGGDESADSLLQMMTVPSFVRTTDQMLETMALEITFKDMMETLTEENLVIQMKILVAGFLCGMAVLQEVLDSGEMR